MRSRSSLGRLAQEAEYRAVYREGRRRVTTHLVIHARPNGQEIVRLGIPVGRRFGGAVVRNRLRRRLREAVRWWLGQVAPGVDLVIVPRAGAARVPFAALREDVKVALANAGAWRQQSGGPV